MSSAANKEEDGSIAAVKAEDGHHVSITPETKAATFQDTTSCVVNSLKLANTSSEAMENPSEKKANPSIPTVKDRFVSPTKQKRPPAENHAHPSPVYLATGWPQRSPMDAPPRNRDGTEHRCAATDGSSSDSNPPPEDDHHEDVAHALFTDSFETISACELTVHQPQDGLLSPRQKTHSPPADDSVFMSSPRKKSRATSSSNNDDYKKSTIAQPTMSSSTDTRDEEPNHNNRRHYRLYDVSPRSPPQRVIHVDGKDADCADISPIKFFHRDEQNEESCDRNNDEKRTDRGCHRYEPEETARPMYSTTPTHREFPNPPFPQHNYPSTPQQTGGGTHHHRGKNSFYHSTPSRSHPVDFPFQQSSFFYPPPYHGAVMVPPPPQHQYSGPWMDHHGYPPPPHAPFPMDNFHSHPQQQHHHPASERHPALLRNEKQPTKTTKPASKSQKHPSEAPPIPTLQYPHPVFSGNNKDPFHLLRSVRKVFQGCSYLFYPAHVGRLWSEEHPNFRMDPVEFTIAQRRIESAICALGGYIKDVRDGDYSHNTSPSSGDSHSTGVVQPTFRLTHMPASIFRGRDAHHNNSKPSIFRASTTSSSDYYKDRFHQRYFIGGHGISWEVEENPPVFVSGDEDDHIEDPRPKMIRNNGMRTTNSTGILQKDSSFHSKSTFSGGGGSKRSFSESKDSDHTQKMKYRCKLCGQPKHNHVCPYRKSLVRTIGVMVVPSVNAYASSEPGILTHALSEMNNFVPYRSESSDVDTVVSPHSQGYRLTPGSIKPSGYPVHCHSHATSPATSSLSTSPHCNNTHRNGHTPPSTTRTAKQPTSLSLRPEQFRAVTPRTPHRNNSSTTTKVENDDHRDDKEESLSSGSFDYPHVPLTYPSRKRLSDTLFYLSQQIPPVITDVAALLRLARERDEWDLAVAEILTQLVVCLFCSDDDYQLDGLGNYLLKIGIAS